MRMNNRAKSKIIDWLSDQEVEMTTFKWQFWLVRQQDFFSTFQNKFLKLLTSFGKFEISLICIKYLKC